MRLLALIFGLLCLVLMPASSAPVSIARAAPSVLQDDDGENTAPPPPVSDNQARKVSSITGTESHLSIQVLLLGVIVVVAEFLLLRKRVVTAEEALKVYAVTLIIVGTLFAITAGYTSQDVAPAMGLFGTMAGYLLGKKSSMPQEEKAATAKGEEE
jgi:hypothetical protein